MIHARPGMIALLALCLVPAPSGGAPSTGSVTGTITVLVGGKPTSDRSKVVVYLEGAGPAITPAAKHTIRQRELQFTPQLSIVAKGTTVDFPNDDKVFHNVFSTSRPARCTSWIPRRPPRRSWSSGTARP